MTTSDLAGFANEWRQPLPDLIAGAIAMAKPRVQATYKRRRATMGQWAMMLEPGPPSQFGSEPDAPPPIAVREMAPLPALRLTAGATASRSDAAIGEVWKMGLQELSRLSPGSIELSLELVAEHVADGLEEELVTVLEAGSFTSAQTEALAFSATTLGAALLKHAALRTPGGALGPYAQTVLLAPDVMPAYVAAFPFGFPGLTPIVSRLLPTGRWYVLPPANRAPVALIASESIAIEDKSFNVDAALNYEIRVFALTYASATVLTAADGSPRWTIKGGA